MGHDWVTMFDQGPFSPRVNDLDASDGDWEDVTTGARRTRSTALGI